jgi:hypothetical protein
MLLLGTNPSVRPKNLSTLFFVRFSDCQKMQTFEPFASISRPAGTHDRASAFSNRVKHASVFAGRRRAGRPHGVPIGCEPDDQGEEWQRHPAHSQEITPVHFGDYFFAVLPGFLEPVLALRTCASHGASHQRSRHHPGGSVTY